MNAVTLEVFFYGLIAFVPHDTTFTALLQNAPNDHAVFHGHQPLLGIPKVNVPGACNQVGGNINPHEPTCVWPLSFQRVVLPPSADPLVLTQGKRTWVDPWTLSPIPSSSTEAEDLSWLTAIRENTPEVASIDPHCLDSVPTCGVKNASVVARVDVTAGVVRTCHLAADDSEKAYAFEFVDLPTHGNAKLALHAIADGVGVKASITSYKIQLVSFGGTTTDIDTQPDGSGLIRVFVFNVPIQETHGEYGDDFALLYDFSKPGEHFPDPSRFIPHKLTKPPPKASVQPLDCYAEFALSFMAAAEARAKSTGTERILSPNLRPICPMAMYSP